MNVEIVLSSEQTVESAVAVLIKYYMIHLMGTPTNDGRSSCGR